MRWVVTSFLVVLLAAAPCLAVPSFIAPFTGSTTVNFESFTNGDLISNQLQASQGISFSSALGGIYANDSYIATVGSTMNATSFQQVCPCVPVTYTWTNPITMVGFVLGTNAGTTIFDLSSGQLTMNSPQFPQLSNIYIGDPGGFTSLKITAPSNNAFVTDNITFDGAAAVPEPATALLLGGGAVGLALVRRRLVRK